MAHFDLVPSAGYHVAVARMTFTFSPPFVGAKRYSLKTAEFWVDCLERTKKTTILYGSCQGSVVFGSVIALCTRGLRLVGESFHHLLKLRHVFFVVYFVIFKACVAH